MSTLPDLLDSFEAGLTDFPRARKTFGRIKATLARVEGPSLELSRHPRHHADAVALCRRFGMGVAMGPPSLPYTWSGQAVRGDMEPSVIVHEVAHLQVAAPERRSVIDFGLGAGPETIDADAANQAMTVVGAARDREETLASLLGIMWECELGHPAILAFLEQNWLEGGASRRNRDHFVRVLEALAALGLADADGRPTTGRRLANDMS